MKLLRTKKMGPAMKITHDDEDIMFVIDDEKERDL